MDTMAAVILAAGMGKRMRSQTPKVLHSIAGRALVEFPIGLALAVGCRPVVVVVGHGRERVEELIRAKGYGDTVKTAIQEEQNGTGHAVKCAIPLLGKRSGSVLILSGDVPLLDRASITKLKRAYDKSGGPLAFLSFCPENPDGYGRVIREGNRVVGIREHRDCNGEEKQIKEVNSGIYLIDLDFLRRSISRLKNDNAQGELYLTDLVAEAANEGVASAVEVGEELTAGVNSRLDLAHVEELVRKKTNEQFMLSGVTMRRPDTICIDLSVTIGKDTELGPGVELRGATRVGKGCRVETGAIVTDATIGDGAVIRAYSVIEKATVGPDAEIGPIGRLRPGADIKRGAKVGNFVEVKNTTLGAGSKANHLAYLGDGQIGKGCNVGAGTIFCNYDGFQKHVTTLHDGVFIGSDSQLVAPVTVGKNAYVASGSTITRDVPEDALAVARARQENKPKVAKMLRKRLQAAKERALATAKEALAAAKEGKN